MYPILSCGGNCFVLSTVNGIGNWFEETYHDALSAKNSWFVSHFDYSECPDYQDKEKVAEMRKNIGEKNWHQEVLCDFLFDSKLPSEIDILKFRINKVIDSNQSSKRELLSSLAKLLIAELT